MTTSRATEYLQEGLNTLNKEIDKFSGLLVMIRYAVFQMGEMEDWQGRFEDWCAAGGAIPIPAIWLFEETIRDQGADAISAHLRLLRAYRHLYPEAWVLRNLIHGLASSELISRERFYDSVSFLRRREHVVFDTLAKRGLNLGLFFSAQQSTVIGSGITDVVEETLEYRVHEWIRTAYSNDQLWSNGLLPWDTFRREHNLASQAGMHTLGSPEAYNLDWIVLAASIQDDTILLIAAFGELVRASNCSPRCLPTVLKWARDDSGIGPRAADQVFDYLLNQLGDERPIALGRRDLKPLTVKEAVQVAMDPRYSPGTPPEAQDSRSLYETFRQSLGHRLGELVESGRLLVSNDVPEIWPYIQNVVTVAISDYRVQPTWRASDLLRYLVEAAYAVHDIVQGQATETVTIENGAAWGIYIAIDSMVETDTSNNRLGIPNDSRIRMRMMGMAGEMQWAIRVGDDYPKVIGIVLKAIKDHQA